MSLKRLKQNVSAFHQALIQAKPDQVKQVLERYSTQDAVWRGVHPFNEQKGCEAVASTFWGPLLSAFTSLQQRQDIFFAGYNQMDDFKSAWVVSMGHWVGLFDAPFLQLKPTGKIAFIRYGMFHRVDHGNITETALFLDIPHLMVQAGYQPFATQRGAQLIQPGPQTHDGVLWQDAQPQAGEATLRLINKMISDLGTWKHALPLAEELRLTWHEDMMWWGPTGIGSSYTVPRYMEQHSAPFRAAFSHRSNTQHLCRMAEGHYGGFFGWPNFTATHEGGFLEQLPPNVRTEFRVIDLYRRHQDKLAENWVFIDLLHLLHQHGIDILPD